MEQLEYKNTFYASGENPHYLDLIEWDNGTRLFVHGVDQYDEDLYGGGLLRVSPDANDEPYEPGLRIRADHCKLIYRRENSIPTFRVYSEEEISSLMGYPDYEKERKIKIIKEQLFNSIISGLVGLFYGFLSLYFESNYQIAFVASLIGFGTTQILLRDK